MLKIKCNNENVLNGKSEILITFVGTCQMQANYSNVERKELNASLGGFSEKLIRVFEAVSHELTKHREYNEL